MGSDIREREREGGRGRGAKGVTWEPTNQGLDDRFFFFAKMFNCFATSTSTHWVLTIPA